MRSATAGGLVERRISAKELREKHGAGLRAHKSESSATDLIRGLLKMHRANEYPMPTHKTRTTRSYPVSFPV
jgi:hypothetical protein